jgi:hypothetical protein
MTWVSKTTVVCCTSPTCSISCSPLPLRPCRGLTLSSRSRTQLGNQAALRIASLPSDASATTFGPKTIGNCSPDFLVTPCGEGQNYLYTEDAPRGMYVK